jgi:uncharacterized protein (UPF0332 family)
LKKAEKEIKETGIHRGLLKTEPSIELAKKHIIKAEHNLKAIMDFKNMGYSDWSASASFYTIYHSLLSILAKKGYDSRNQECTFALIYHLINTDEIDLNINLIKEVHLENLNQKHESVTIIELRELEQYGVSVSLEEDLYEKILKTSKEILDVAKEIVES